MRGYKWKGKISLEECVSKWESVRKRRKGRWMSRRNEWYSKTVKGAYFWTASFLSLLNCIFLSTSSSSIKFPHLKCFPPIYSCHPHILPTCHPLFFFSIHLHFVPFFLYVKNVLPVIPPSYHISYPLPGRKKKERWYNKGMGEEEKRKEVEQKGKITLLIHTDNLQNLVPSWCT